MSATINLHTSIDKDDFLVMSVGSVEHRVAVKHCLAAPELLSALTDMLALYEAGAWSSINVKAARDAIEKATA